MIETKYCRNKFDIEAGSNAMIGDLVAFGITHDHATSFAYWIVEDVIVPVVNMDAMCFPPERTDEMGTRLGNLISQDIIGERPRKRGRRITTFVRKEEEEELTATPKRKKTKKVLFRFGESNRKDETLAKQKCCKCPALHYEWSKEGKNKCAKGPCCPQLCRTLERLAGALSAARFTCCEKAHQDCLRDEKVSVKVEAKKTFKFKGKM